MAYFYLLKQLWKYTDEERWKIILYLVLHVISILGELGKPLAFAMVINALQKNTETVIQEVVFWFGIFILCFFVFEIFHRSARFIERHTAFRARRRFITQTYDHLQSLPLSWHTDHHSGSTIDRVNKASSALFMFGQSQMYFVNVFVKFWAPMIVLWQISPIISIVATIAGGLMIFSTKAIYKLSVPEYRAQNEGFHKVASALHDYVSNITTIITLRLGEFVEEDLTERINLVFPYLKKENILTQIKCFISSFLMLSINVGLIFYYIVSQKNAGAIVSIGTVTAISQYLKEYMVPFEFYAGDYETAIHWRTDFEAVQPILDEQPGVDLSDGDYYKNWNSLKIENLDYSYGKDEAGLRNVSLNLNSGKRIAFVGSSGAGKSTLLKVLRGLIPIENGRLKVDGSSVEHSISSLAGTTTLIPQEPEIFENDIRYNITMGMMATDEEIEKAMHIAGFSEVVKKFPNGLDTDIREKGVNMSGGEKQRLALSRGIFAIRDSEIVLLDEPTSNVDPATEASIFNRVFESLSDKCVVSVLHRLHLVKMFDYVYVLKDGEIVEEGTFEKLRTNDGEFTRLWNKYLAEEEKTT
ncbi:MAG: ABC transporter ATP-binding protein [Filifactoraceae bacterium]